MLDRSSRAGARLRARQRTTTARRRETKGALVALETGGGSVPLLEQGLTLCLALHLGGIAPVVVSRIVGLRHDQRGDAGTFDVRAIRLPVARIHDVGARIVAV